MLMQAVGTVTSVTDWGADAQELTVDAGEMGTRHALNYPSLTGPVAVGNTVLLNTTAVQLHLGTGGFDFVMANVTEAPPAPNNGGASGGHIIKGRYLPTQCAVLTLEEQQQYAAVWEKTLDGFPVLVGQLHSQIAPAAAALWLSGKEKVAYIMTDAGALPLAFSNLTRELKRAALLSVTLTCGQAFGGDMETVTLHSALLGAKHIADCDAAIVCQGPGNAGTATKYGFSGMEQAHNLDIVKALGGTPIAIVRMSESDARPRHFGISHHTRTALEFAYARCVVPVPTGTDSTLLPPGHDVRFVDGTNAALELLETRGIEVRTMGRGMSDDPLFFRAAAAAGLVIL